MESNLREEIEDIVISKVFCGFSNEEDIFNVIENTFYNEEIDEPWSKEIISNKYSAHQKGSLNWITPTDFQKLDTIFNQLNNEQIISIHNAGYTKQDAGDECLTLAQELINLECNPKGFCTYTEQDVESMINPKSIFYLEYGAIPHSEIAKIRVGNRIVELLEQTGFTIEWDGTTVHRIGIKNMDWKKTPQETEFWYDEIHDIFEKNKPKKQSQEKAKDSKKWWEFWK